LGKLAVFGRALNISASTAVKWAVLWVEKNLT
jgi:hypothetical protein